MKTALDPATGLAPIGTSTVENDIGLAAAIDQAGQAMVVTDVTGKILYVNGAFTKITGYSSQEAIGQAPSILKSGAQDPAYYKQLWDTISAGQIWNGELINRRKDGSTYVEEMVITPVLDPGGKIIRYIAVKRDVTQQRKSDEAQRLLAAIVDSSQDAIFCITLDGIILTWNDAAEAVYGYSATEAIGKSVSILLPPDKHAERIGLLEGVKRGEKLSQYETQRLAKGGRLIDVSISASAVKDDAGRIIAVATTARDITEQLLKDQAMRDYAERSRALFERSLDCLYVHDFNGNFLDANPAMVKLLGYERDEFLTLNSAQLLSPDQMPKVFRARAELDRTGLVGETVEYRVRCKGGGFVDIETMSTAIPYQSPTRAILGMARDITEHKRALEALRGSEEKFRQLAENIREVFWMMNAAGTEILYVSPAYQSIWGRTCEELYSNPMAWMESIEPGDRETAHSIFLRQMEGQDIESEYRIRTPQGNVKWVRDRAFPIRDQAGRIIRVAGIAEDITARKKAETELAHQAQHDHLTGLPNRQFLSQRLEAGIDRARKGSLTMAIVYVDLDGFKFVNDTLGHDAGDALLQQVTDRLQACVRDRDTLARMGGDEFMLLINEVVDDQTALVIAQRLQAALRKPFSVGEHQLCVTASIGVAMYPRDGADVNTLRRNADTAMYWAKRIGKDRVQLFSAAMQDTLQEHLQLETALRNAVETDTQLSVVYQPILQADGERQTAFEALLRWTHPALGTIPPAKFVPIAEENGLIVKLGAWVLRRACHKCRAWQEHGYRGVRVSVNVSAVEFAQPEFAAHVQRILEETGLPGDLLDLEVTETTLMHDMDECARKLGVLRAQGIRISIDDFGTGYSSLGYLARLPLDTLKVDRSFVAELGINATSRALLEAMISLAHSLGKRIVVEGVETFEQLETLRSIGCDEVQGFLLGRPAPLPAWHEVPSGVLVTEPS